MAALQDLSGFWSSQRQILILTRGFQVADYIGEVAEALRKKHQRVDADFSQNTLNSKLRLAKNAGQQFIIFVTPQEAEHGKVTVQDRPNEPISQFTIDEQTEWIHGLVGSPPVLAPIPPPLVIPSSASQAQPTATRPSPTSPRNLSGIPNAPTLDEIRKQFH